MFVIVFCPAAEGVKMNVLVCSRRCGGEKNERLSCCGPVPPLVQR